MRPGSRCGRPASTPLPGRAGGRGPEPGAARLPGLREARRGRLNATALAAHKALLEGHAELFAADEELFFTYAMRGHDLLTDEQIDRAEAIYLAEKDQGRDRRGDQERHDLSRTSRARKTASGVSRAR